MRITVLILTFLMFAGTGCWKTLSADEPLPTISVSGSAVVKVVPDRVVITAAVESRAQELANAVKDNDGKISSVIDFLRTSGVQDEHIRTEVLQIQPIMPTKGYARQTMQSNAAPPAVADTEANLVNPLGYTVRRQFAITLTQLGEFEKIYRGLVERGINNVAGVEFQSTELRKHRDEARLLSVRAAREKATAMSGELGATLAGIKSIDESFDGRWRGRNMLQNVASSAGGEASFAAGQIEITATVSVVFYLGNSQFDD